MKKFYYKPLCIVECVLFLSYKNGNRAPLDLFEALNRGGGSCPDGFLPTTLGSVTAGYDKVGRLRRPLCTVFRNTPSSHFVMKKHVGMQMDFS